MPLAAEQQGAVMGEQGEQRRGSWDNAPLTSPRCSAPRVTASAPRTALTGSQRCCPTGTQAHSHQALSSRVVPRSSTEEPCPASSPGISTRAGEPLPSRGRKRLPEGRASADPPSQSCCRVLHENAALSQHSPIQGVPTAPRSSPGLHTAEQQLLRISTSSEDHSPSCTGDACSLQWAPCYRARGL